MDKLGKLMMGGGIPKISRTGAITPRRPKRKEGRDNYQNVENRCMKNACRNYVDTGDKVLFVTLTLQSDASLNTLQYTPT